jgi:hypothetical protein
MERLSNARRRALLGHRQRLNSVTRTDDQVAITESLIALHSSDPATVHLSAAARMINPSVVPMATALYEERSLVRHHGMRRTIWVYTPEIARIVHASSTADIARAEWKQLVKWVAASGIANPETWVANTRADTLAALREHGPCTARVLGKAVPALTQKIDVGSGRYVVAQPAHTRMLQNLGFDAEIVRAAPSGSWTSSEYQWNVMADWLPEGLAGMDPTLARHALVERYLRSFGPATTADVQWWTGWSMGATKAAITATGAVEVSLEDDVTGWVLPDDLDARDPIDDTPWVALLPSLDPTAMGWKQRDWYLGEWTTFGGPLFDRNGNVGPTVWVNGEVVGGWTQQPTGGIVYELLQPVDSTTRRQIAAAAEQLRSAIGDARVTPRFPTPLQKELGSR